MGKKSNSIGFLYAAGAAVTAAGFCLPIFRQAPEILGKTVVMLSMNGFSFLSDEDIISSAAILSIFVFAILGFLASFVKTPKKQTVKIILLAVGIAGGILFACRNQTLFSKMSEYLFAGFYAIIAGWIISIAGIAMDK